MQRVKLSPKDTALRVLLRFYLFFFTAMTLLPVFWTLYTSFKTNKEFFANPWALPSALNFDNYVRAWNEASVGDYFLNSLYITIIVVPLLALLGAMTAYACTRLKLKAGNVVIGIFLLGVFIPTVLCVVPIFLQMKEAKLLDSHLGLILLLLAVNLPLTVYILTGVFRTIPHELEEAATIDGCNHFKIFFKVMLPLSKGGIATVSIFNFLSVWNEYVLTRTVILSSAKNTIPVGLVSLQATSTSQADWAALFAGMVGCFADSLLGATLERNGLFNNEHVNLTATIIGALVGIILTTIGV